MIELEDVPELNNPVVIAAFEGWNDAGEAATAAIDHLVDVWDAEAVAALDPEDYYDFQVNRPRVVLDDGRRRIHWRTTRILVAHQRRRWSATSCSSRASSRRSAGVPSPSS